MLHALIKHPRVESRPIEMTYRRLTQKQIEKNGVLVSECVFEDFDFSKQNVQFHWRDFSIDNLESIGIKLDPVVMREMNQMDNIDRISHTLQSLDNEQVKS